METKLKTFLAAALVAGAGTAAWGQAALPTGDVSEEEVVAFGEAEFWLGPDEIAVAWAEMEFALTRFEFPVALPEPY